MEQELQNKSEDKKVHAENMRLKKHIIALEKELKALKEFIFGGNYESIK